MLPIPLAPLPDVSTPVASGKTPQPPIGGRVGVRVSVGVAVFVGVAVVVAVTVGVSDGVGLESSRSKT
jgi:hypothetical protein